MNKQKKPCKCGHKAGNHGIVRTKKVPLRGMPYVDKRHTGGCAKCDCGGFKEQP